MAQKSGKKQGQLKLTSYFIYNVDEPPLETELSSVALPEGIKAPNSCIVLYYGHMGANEAMHIVRNRVENEGLGNDVSTVIVTIQIGAIANRNSRDYDLKPELADDVDKAKQPPISLFNFSRSTLSARQLLEKEVYKGSVFKNSEHGAGIVNLALVEKLFDHVDYQHIKVIIVDVPDYRTETGFISLALVRDLSIITDVFSRDVETIVKITDEP